MSSQSDVSSLSHLPDTITFAISADPSMDARKQKALSAAQQAVESQRKNTVVYHRYGADSYTDQSKYTQQYKGNPTFKATAPSRHHQRFFPNTQPSHPAGWMSRSQRHKANKRAARKAAAEAAAAEKTEQNSKTRLLKIPAEIRLIYEYAMINDWDERQHDMNHMLSACSREDDAMHLRDRELPDPYDDFNEYDQARKESFARRNRAIKDKKEEFKRKSAEPALLRVCRLMRSEGMEVYYQSLEVEKSHLTGRAHETYSVAEEKITTAPNEEWLSEEAKLMAVMLDQIQDVEKEIRKLEHFGLGIAAGQQEVASGEVKEVAAEADEVDSEDEERDSDVVRGGISSKKELPDVHAIAILSLKAKGLSTFLDHDIARGSLDPRHRNIDALDEAMFQDIVRRGQEQGTGGDD